jgi:hypothetical protein
MLMSDEQEPLLRYFFFFIYYYFFTFVFQQVIGYILTNNRNKFSMYPLLFLRKANQNKTYTYYSAGWKQ